MRSFAVASVADAAEDEPELEAAPVFLLAPTGVAGAEDCALPGCVDVGSGVSILDTVRTGSGAAIGRSARYGSRIVGGPGRKLRRATPQTSRGRRRLPGTSPSMPGLPARAQRVDEHDVIRMAMRWIATTMRRSHLYSW